MKPRCPTFQLVHHNGLYAVRSHGWLFWGYWSYLDGLPARWWERKYAAWLSLKCAYQLMADAKAAMGCYTPLGRTAETIELT